MTGLLQLATELAASGQTIRGAIPATALCLVGWGLSDAEVQHLARGCLARLKARGGVGKAQPGQLLALPGLSQSALLVPELRPAPGTGLLRRPGLWAGSPERWLSGLLIGK